jgi:hypothetical protein
MQLVNANLSMYAALYFGTTRSEYRICDPNNMQIGNTPEPFAGQRFCIDSGRTPLPTDSQGQQYCPYPANDGYTTEQYSIWGVLEATSEGADATLVKGWSDWNNAMWP